MPTYPLLELPVVAEQETFPKNEVWKSQLARAAVPWVHHWRLPMLQFGEDALWLSQFKAYYVEFTQSDIIEMTTRAKKNGIQLLILKDLDVLEGNKGEEKWSYSDGSKRAEELFAIVGFAQHERREIAAPRFFDSPHKDGFGAFAQAMIYNANQTTRRLGHGDRAGPGRLGHAELCRDPRAGVEGRGRSEQGQGRGGLPYYRDRARRSRRSSSTGSRCSCRRPGLKTPHAGSSATSVSCSTGACSTSRRPGRTRRRWFSVFSRQFSVLGETRQRRWGDASTAIPKVQRPSRSSHRRFPSALRLSGNRS